MLKTGFVVAALAAMALLVDFAQLANLVGEISPGLFLVVLCIVIFDQAFMGAKWNILLRVVDVRVPAWVPVLAYLRGRIFSFIAPSSLGIDAYKLYCVQAHDRKISAIVSSIVIERVFGILSSLSLVVLLLPVSIDYLGVPYAGHAGLISVLGFAVICLLLHLVQSHADMARRIGLPGFLGDKMRRLFDEFVVNLARIKQGRWQVWFYFGLSIIEKSSYGLAVYFAARALGLSEPGPLLIVAVAPLVALMERIPVSVSAIGIREGLFVILFAPFYNDVTLAITVSLVLRAAEVSQTLIFLLTWFFGRSSGTIKDELELVEAEYEKIP